MQLRLLILILVSAALTTSAYAQSPRKTVHDVQLESGITLADWLNLPAQKAKEPSLEAGAQAAAYVNRYGPFRELLSVAWLASQAKPLRDTAITLSNADQKKGELSSAIERLGIWPGLLMARARAAAVLGDEKLALSDLKVWLLVAPASDKLRPVIVDLLVAAERSNQGIADYFRSNIKREELFGLASTPVRPRIGDHWTVENKDAGGEIRHDVIETDSSGLFKVKVTAKNRPDAQQIDTYDANWEIVSRIFKTPGLSFEARYSGARTLPYPLDVGQTWGYTRMHKICRNSPYSGPSCDESRVAWRAKVTGSDSVHLPNGQQVDALLVEFVSEDADGKMFRNWFTPKLGTIAIRGEGTINGKPSQTMLKEFSFASLLQ